MKPRPRIVDRMLDALRESHSVCVVGHVRPDGDCIGSQLALALALKAEGKEVTCWNEDRIPKKLAFLDPDRVVERPGACRPFDCVIATDCASTERLGEARKALKEAKVLINIDHHESNARYGDLNWVHTKSPSTGELVFRLVKYAGWPITPRIADCLFAAISTDTGSFQYPSTRPATFVTAGDLVKRGADLGAVCNRVYHSYPLSRVRLLRHVYNRFRMTDDERIAWFWLKQADFARTGADKSDAEGLIDHIRAIEPVVVAVVFEEVTPNLTRVSLRSKDERVNVNEVAALFGGGGHAAAAGARIEGSPVSAQRRVVAALRKALVPLDSH